MDPFIEFKVGEGLSTTPPLLNDSVMPNLTPMDFVDWFRWRFETTAFVLETFEAIVRARSRATDRSYEARAYYQTIIERFQNHSDWEFLRPALDNRPMLPQAIVPHSRPNNDLAFFKFGGNRFVLPWIKQSLFNASGLDAQLFLEELLERNPGRLKQLDHCSVLVGVGQFALQRFQGAFPGLDKQFIKQFGVEPGLTAFKKHIQDREALKIHEHDFRNGHHGDVAAWRAEVQRPGFGKYVMRSRAGRRGMPPRMTSPITRPTGSDPFAKRAILFCEALLVSRLSIEKRADSLTPIHFHQLEQGLANDSSSAKLELLGAQHRYLVIPFDNDFVKDRALAHIEQARFDFLDEENVKLNVSQLSEGTAIRTKFVLGSAPLKSLGRLDDALRPFFAKIGHVQTKDIMGYPLHIQTTKKVIIGRAACPDWLQKSTVTRDGPRDQQIQLERAATCIFCNRDSKVNQIRSEQPCQSFRSTDTARNHCSGLQSALHNQVRECPSAMWQTPRGREVVPGDSNAPHPNRYRDHPVAAVRAPLASNNGLKDGTVPQQAAHNQNWAQPTMVTEGPARASKSRPEMSAPNRKRQHSPDASTNFEPR